MIYTCAKCGVTLETPDALGGQTEPCPECGAMNTIPVSSREQKRRQKEGPATAKEQAAPGSLLEKLAQDESPAMPARPRDRPPYPTYFPVSILWWVLAVSSVSAVGLGALMIISPLIGWSGHEVLLGVLFVLGGLTTLGLAEVFNCIRDIAQNSFYLRKDD